MDLSANGLMAVFVLIFLIALRSPNGLTILLREHFAEQFADSLLCSAKGSTASGRRAVHAAKFTINEFA